VSIPEFQKFMRPLLEAVADGEVHRVRDLADPLADLFEISQEDREVRLPSGQQTTVRNRVSWAGTYMKRAGLLENAGRGKIRITDEGRRVLTETQEIDSKYLEQYQSFLEFKGKKKPDTQQTEDDTETETDQTPEEAIETAYRDLSNALAGDLLERVMGCSPEFFERLVVQLLVAMGYGGSLEDAGEAVGRSGDDGIDGTIKEDRLGLDVICIQAKRWQNTVGRPMVQAFAGSMEGVRAKKGVLITTASFSKEAIEYVTRIERKIVLIDGQMLANLMIEHGIGTTPVKAYQLSRADNDFFEDGSD
jgi:restriction system protein